MLVNRELAVPNILEIPGIGEQLSQAKQLKDTLRSKHNELGAIIPIESQEKNIYANREIFEFFGYVEEHGNDQEFHFLSEILDSLKVPQGTRAYVAGSGWGLWAREMARHRQDLRITNIDINPAIVNMDAERNNKLGMGNISSVVGDATKIAEIESAAQAGPPNFFTTVGLMRYLSTEQRTDTLESIWDAMKPGDFALVREVNYISMRDCARILDERGIPYESQVRQVEHLKYTTLFFYYYLYNNYSPVPETISKDGLHFDQEGFKRAVDKVREYYPDFGFTKEDGSYVDLRHLLVLADLAGKEEKSEYVILFTKQPQKAEN